MPDYNTIQDLPYLMQVISETLRLHPALAIATRGCIMDYKIPGTEIELKKGDEIFINIAGIHQDPRYYPEPEKFDPERFSPEEKAKRHP